MEKNRTLWSTASPSALFIGSLLQHCRLHLKALQTRKQNTEALKNFVKDMKEQTKEISYELEEEPPDTQRWYIRRRSDNTAPLPVASLRSNKDCEDVYCELCQCMFKKAEKQYPCRICEGIFHKDCVMGIKNLHPSHKSTIERAETKDDLSLLLSEDELNNILQTFDEEINPKGDHISFEEFLAFKKRQHDITEEDHDHLRLEFQLVDTDSNGQIDWWEFLTYQAKMRLFSRSQEELVDLLTVKEMEVAQSAFSRLKLNKSGRVSPGESRRLLSEWYRFLDGHGGKDDVLDNYARLASTRVMALDKTPLQDFSWKEFLMGQAKYIIGARPNMVKIK